MTEWDGGLVKLCTRGKSYDFSRIRRKQGSAGQTDSPHLQLLPAGTRVNEWKHGISVGLGSAAKPTSTATKADGSTKGAVSGSVATIHEEK